MRQDWLYKLLVTAAILTSVAFALNKFVFAKSYPVTVTYNPPPSTLQSALL